jgi:hypothetical protein
VRPALSTKLQFVVCIKEVEVGFPVAGDTDGTRGILRRRLVHEKTDDGEQADL